MNNVFMKKTRKLYVPKINDVTVKRIQAFKVVEFNL